jgi:PucR C-terminal helix-turn-helix domain
VTVTALINPAAGLAAVGRSLAATADALVDRQLAVLATHSSYAELRELDLRSSALRNVQRTIATVSGGTPEGAEDLGHEEFAEMVSTVLHVVPGLGAQDVVSAYRAAMGVIRDAFIEEADRVGLAPESVVSGLRRIWQLTDDYSELLAAAHCRVIVDGRLGGRDRARYLRHALEGELSGRDLELGLAQLGLAPEQPVRVLRVHVEGPIPQRLIRDLESKLIGWPGEPLMTRIDGDLAGLVAVLPTSIDAEAYVAAVSEPVLPEAVHEGHLVAVQVLGTAVRFGINGVVAAADLGLRAAMLAVPTTSEALLDAYVRSVQVSTPMATDLLHTVETFLGCQRRFQRTAEELNMHVNSLRHRLERYREITGADLAETETVAEVWWALQYARAVQVLA